MRCLLPEILGKWYTRPSVPQSDNSQCEQARKNSNDVPKLQQVQQNQGTFCNCHGLNTGMIIGCDNKDCPIQWFHIKCLDINKSSIPKGDWYCPDCQELPEFKGKGKAKKLKQ